jgi:predicted glycoside hydrolase/deacetylase ChbG (UPF0249 family)
MKRIILCADDYGQNPAISQAIINLFEKKRISATSCMTNADSWSNDAKFLQPYKSQVDIGLHLNLSEGRPLSNAFKKAYGEEMLPLSTLLVKAHLRQLDKNIIVDEVAAQIDSFTHEMDCLPDYIDGHQHVHQFPIIREAVIELYERRFQGHHCYIRSVNDTQVWSGLWKEAGIKRLIIQLTGARKMRQLLREKNIPHNTSFSGVYDFANAKDYPEKFPLFLDQVGDGGLIMCHPGLLSDVYSSSDSIYQSRDKEYEYFLSDQFLEDCRSRALEIVRFEGMNRI